MIRRSVLLLSGSVLGLLLAAAVHRNPASGGEAPDELTRAPAQMPAETRDLSRPFVEATKRARPAVVKILNLRLVFGNRLQQAGSGSGFIISDEGHVLTNRHVIVGADRVDLVLLDGRRFENVEVVGADARSDVAVLRIREGAENLPLAALGDSDALEVGEWVIAIGAPFDLESSVSVGVVSATGRRGILNTGFGTSEEFIQTDAALNPGNSGGPLVNLAGQVVGMNTAIQTGSPYSRGNAGVGFAVPINLARTIAVSLIEHGVAQRGWLGVAPAAQLGAAELRALGVDARGGVRVGTVTPGSPAAAAGLREGDILIELDGHPVPTVEALQARLATAGPGARVELRVHREDGVHTLQAQLGEEPLFTFGLTVETLTDELARAAGMPGAEGVVVTRVDEGSPAATAEGRNRIYPNDVIERIDVGRGAHYVVRTREDFVNVMRLLDRVRPEHRGAPIRFVIRTPEGRYAVLLPLP